jgi:hypothetical protein
MFYGDRIGSFEDPFGHVWHVSTHKEDLTPEEIGRRAAAQDKHVSRSRTALSRTTGVAVVVDARAAKVRPRRLTSSSILQVSRGGRPCLLSDTYGRLRPHAL